MAHCGVSPFLGHAERFALFVQLNELNIDTSDGNNIDGAKFYSGEFDGCGHYMMYRIWTEHTNDF
ncbi:MAG: hypothetical protein ACLRZ7_10740 [Lachnospiraceae bacterium]